MSGNDNIAKNTKLEWYREVLSLDPNSKLFLPFARLLAELGKEENNADLINEAFKVLHHGLDIHPDFMEARLFLIELLNLCGCKSQCGAEVARLASLFLSYPDFWDAWREYAITEHESSDFTVALGFMSAIMRNKSLSIVQVLEAGLNALKTNKAPVFSADITKIAQELEKSAAEKSPAQSMAEIQHNMQNLAAEPFAAAEEEPSVPEEQPETLEENGISLENAAEENGECAEPLEMQEEVSAVSETENTADSDAAEFSADGADGADMMAEEDFSAQAEENAEVPADEIAAEEVPAPELTEEPSSEEKSLESVELQNGLEEVLPKSHIENYANFAEQQKIVHDKTLSTKETLAELIRDANITIEPIEKSPFRTKGMADLLAEQGDYKGAYDIYQELLHKGYGDKQELQERIEDLKMLCPDLVISDADKSQLLAIDDMVDTSFGLMAKSLSTLEAAGQDLGLEVKDFVQKTKADSAEVSDADSADAADKTAEMQEGAAEDFAAEAAEELMPETSAAAEDLMPETSAEVCEAEVLEPETAGSDIAAEEILDEDSSLPAEMPQEVVEGKEIAEPEVFAMNEAEAEVQADIAADIPELGDTDIKIEEIELVRENFSEEDGKELDLILDAKEEDSAELDAADLFGQDNDVPPAEGTAEETEILFEEKSGEPDLSVMADLEEIGSFGESGAKLEVEKADTFHSDVADLLTKLAQRLEVRANEE